MKLVYPVCFYPEDNGGYSVDVPDLLGCVTQGDSLADAMEMAVDAACGWILSSLEDAEEIPKPSKLEDIKPEYENGIVNYVMLDIDSYAEKYGNKAIRKNLTIPAWLNTIAEKHNVNYSRVLQNALQAELKDYLAV
ncbi:MAG: type II toxin-antitoxin system HicB family antitoxin [Lachnospiraceae bacterium]|jgi:predicted RNase H-like HicB family nuclease|nr:type II toxin-antitoxin system HicB family antitoxin [Lachnospiraceae bacterium]